MENKADVTISNEDGETACRIAQERHPGKLEMIALLQSATRAAAATKAAVKAAAIV